MAEQRRWSDFSRTQQTAMIVAGAVEAVLTTAALIDLARRPRTQVRGPRLLWALGCVVQPVGPIAYLAVGRRRR
ncbi:MAG: PLD nuclease N-terminal domain-containing protein [Gaiellales bacterium]